MILSTYATNTRDIVNDPNGTFYSTAALYRWINRARREVAKQGQCVRLLTPYTASVTGFTQASGGSGYTSPPTVTVSGPDAIAGPTYVTATGTAVLSGNSVASITISVPGSGYVKAPTVTLSGGGGSGASFTANLGTHYTTTPGVELYNFTDAATALNNTAVEGIIDILGISVAYAGTKATLMETDFATLQAYARSYGVGQMYPGVWAKYAQGENGSYFLWPTPSDVYGIEADCVCMPADLANDSSVDLIPGGWNEPVYYYAAFLAYQNSLRMDDARTMFGEYQRLMASSRANSSSLLIPSMYG